MNKKIIKFLGLAIMSTLVAGCGATTNDSKEGNSIDNASSENVISSSAISSNAIFGSDVISSSSSIDVVSSSSSSSSAKSSSSSSSSQQGGQWSGAASALMSTYCGGDLPYVNLKTGYTAQESADYYGIYYLEIYDENTSFTIENYYVQLQNAGWEMMTNDQGGYKLVDEEGFEWYEAHKTANNGADAYTVEYYYYEGYGNCIDCYHMELDVEKTTDTAWDEDTSSLMISTLTEELPFMQLGKNYFAQAENFELLIVDGYYQDLTADYINLLTSSGYSHVGEDEYGYAVYEKALANDAKLQVSAYYTFGYGNYIYACFIPNEITVNTWPSNIFEDIEELTGYSIPSYSASSYTYYEFQDSIVISSDSSASKEEAYQTALNNAGYVTSTNSAQTFEETIDIYFEDKWDYDDDEEYVIIGFKVVVTLTNETSTFVNSYPVTEVCNYLSTIAVTGTTLPTVEDLNFPHKKIKYFQIDLDNELIEMIYEEEYALYVEWGVYDEQEAWDAAYNEAKAMCGFYVCIYDRTKQAFNEFTYRALDNADLFGYAVDENDYYFENEEGTVAFYVNYAPNQLTIQFMAGLGESHRRELSLNKSSIKIKPGATFQLEEYRAMIPVSNAITWTSDNESAATVSEEGVVTGVANGTANITAKTTVKGVEYSAVCSVTVSSESQTVTLTPSDFDKYDDPAVSKTLHGLTMMVCNVMNQSNKIQLKKNSTNLYNTVAFNPIDSITFEGVNKTNNFTVSAGTSADDLSPITPTIDGSKLIYELDGATFFEVKNGQGVFTCDKIIFEM